MMAFAFFGIFHSILKLVTICDQLKFSGAFCFCLCDLRDALQFFTFFLILPRLLWIRLLPSVRQLLNCTRFGHGLQGLKRIQNNAPLAFDVARFTEHTTARKLDKHGPGRLDVSHAVGGIAHRDSGNSRFLYQALNQTHGLMTFRSDRHQE